MNHHQTTMTSTMVTVVTATIGILLTVRHRKTRPAPHPRRRTTLPDFCTLDPQRQIPVQPQPVSRPQPPSLPQSLIMWFKDIRHDDAALVGGKGANLGELAMNDFPVPPGFGITKHAFDAHLSQTRSSDNRTLLERIETGDMTTSEAHRCVLETPMDPQLVTQLVQAYKALSSNNNTPALVAVRSSATAEDSADASFAGQLETFLGVCGEHALLHAVKQCWASLYSERVESYRRLAGKSRGGNHGSVGASVSCCVVVQMMIDADAAGVMFTANPTTKNRTELVITANFGIGESVVADIATPDTWVIISPPTQILKRDIACKERKVVLRASRLEQQPGSETHTKAGSSEIVPIPISQQRQPCMTDVDLNVLVQLGRRIEKHYGGVPQDVEWALKDGKIYILQSRPITTLEHDTVTMEEFDTPCRANDQITTCNAAEMFPGPMTPLTMSMFGRTADEGVQRMQIEFGVRQFVDRQNRVTSNYSGNYFLNMTNTLAPMVAGMLGGRMAKENGEMSILGRLNPAETMENLTQCAGGLKPFPIRLLNGMRYSYVMLTAASRIPVMRQRIEWCSKAFAPPTTAANERAATLWSLIDSHIDDFDDQWADGIVTSSTSAAFMLFCMKLLVPRGENAWASGPVADIATLLGQVDDNKGVAESAGAVGALDKLKGDMLRDGDGFVTSFCQVKPEAALQMLTSHRVFGPVFQVLLMEQGHRCIKEAEMRERDWSEDPLPLIRMLQNSLKATTPNGGGVSTKIGKTSTDAANLIASKRHLNPLTRTLLRRLVSITRDRVHLRELGKSLQVHLNAVFKHAYRRLSDILVQEGKLSESDLMYFLSHEEIGMLACSPTGERRVAGLKSIALQRRRAYAAQKLLKFPELSTGKPKAVEISCMVMVDGDVLNGTPVSSGMARGYARVARTIEDAEALQEGEILITPQTDVGWTPFFSLASGLVTEIGGMLSHGAVVAREYSMPCVVSVGGACDVIKTGWLVELDGDVGVLRVLSR